MAGNFNFPVNPPNGTQYTGPNNSPNIYPGSAPEFRILVTNAGEKNLQVRYVKPDIGYTGKWQYIPEVQESDVQSNTGK